MSQSQPRVAISNDLFDILWKLPHKIRPKVKSFITRFQQHPNSPGMNRERIRGTRNLYSVRIDQSYRGVLAQDAGTIVLLHVDNHDDAYDWAKRHRFEVNAGSGILQVFEPQPVTGPDPGPEIPEPVGVLATFRDRQLLRLGLPEPLIPLARTVTGEADFDDIKQQFPAEAQDAMWMLLSGYSYEDALDELMPARQEDDIDPNDITTALERPGSRAHFWVVEDEEELKRMLNAPQEKWRVFLHPSQRQLVDRIWNGPVRVLGGAGTGKTVVAMHRARWLATHQAQGSKDRVLFLTFTANLAADLKRNLQELITDNECLQRLEVVHLDSWVYRFMRQHDFPQTIVYNSADERLEEPWTQALQIRDEALGLAPRFYRDEWCKVVLAQGLFTREEYLRARRTGRGTRLSRIQRARIWPVFEAYRAQLRLAGLIEQDEAYHTVRNMIETGAVPLPYVAVVVDEAQDFGYEAFRLIHTLAHGHGSSYPDKANRLFLVGDAHQRIYDRQVVLSRCGIQIRGRSFRLRINYRTSEPILQTALSVLEGMPVDDLDGGTDTLAGYRSLFGGPAPEQRQFASFANALQDLTAWVEQVRQEWNYQYDDFCFVARTRRLRDEWAGSLNHRGMPVHCIEGRATDVGIRDAVHLATAHRVKGLEFSAVVILDADPEHYPLAKALTQAADDTDRELCRRRECSLLHVAMSRAKRHLLLCTLTAFSPFLKSMQDEGITK